jgi:pantothenate kinase
MKKENISGLVKAIEKVLKSPFSNLTIENKRSLNREKLELTKKVSKEINLKDIESILQSIFIIMEIMKEAPQIMEVIKEISPHIK